MSDLKHRSEPWRYERVYPLQNGNMWCAVFDGENRIDVCLFWCEEGDAKRVVECVNALAGIINPELWVKQAQAMLANIMAFEHPEMKLGESKLDFIFKLLAERDAVKNSFITNSFMAGVEAIGKLKSLEPMLNRIHELNEHSRKEYLQLREKMDSLKKDREDAIKGMQELIHSTTVEIAERNGFAPQRDKLCQLYDRLQYGTPNAGGGQ